MSNYNYDRTAAVKPTIREHREAKTDLEKANNLAGEALSAFLKEDFKKAKDLSLQASKAAGRAAASVAEMGKVLDNSKRKIAESA